MLKVVLSKNAEKDLEKVPDYIYEKYLWGIDLIVEIGLHQARKYKGYHDEPLHGSRKGQRSIRLSKSYRVIYMENTDLNLIFIMEVNKHDY